MEMLFTMIHQEISRLVLPRRFSCWPVLIHVNEVHENVEEAGYFTVDN